MKIAGRWHRRSLLNCEGRVSTSSILGNMDESFRLDPRAVRLQWQRRAREPEPDFLRTTIERGLVERLEPMRLEPALIAVASCAQSSLLHPLRQRFAEALIVAFEEDARALGACRDRLTPARPGWLARLRGGQPQAPARFVGFAPLCWPLAANSVDLLISSLYLHSCPQPAQQLAEWLRVLRPGGLMTFACLGVDTLSELRTLGARLHPLPDMHDLGDALVKAGFAEPVVDTERLTVTWRGAATLLDEVRRWGGNALPERFRGLLTPRHRAEWINALEALRRPDGLIAISVEVIFGHAWCPATKPLPGGLAPIHLRRRGADL